jgi:lipopolysaccharide transport system permease protein
MQSDENWDLIVEAGKTERHYWKDLWRFRELFFFLAWRDFLVRYKQTVFGIAWSVIRPVLTMIVFTIIFGKIAKLDSGNIPYPVLVYAAMLPWQFFSNAFQEASNSLIGNVNLISKIYFPRMIVPISTVMVCLIDFLISFAIYAVLIIWYRIPFSSNMLFLPLFLILAFLAAMGTGLLVCALNVKYRDFRYIVPFVVQFGLYISPVGFSSNVISGKWRLLYSINPMVGIIDGFRWALLGKEANLFLPSFMISLCLIVALLFAGILYFRSTERVFADVI